MDQIIIGEGVTTFAYDVKTRRLQHFRRGKLQAEIDSNPTIAALLAHCIDTKAALDAALAKQRIATTSLNKQLEDLQRANDLLQSENRELTFRINSSIK